MIKSFVLKFKFVWIVNMIRFLFFGIRIGVIIFIIIFIKNIIKVFVMEILWKKDRFFGIFKFFVDFFLFFICFVMKLDIIDKIFVGCLIKNELLLVVFYIYFCMI